MVISLNRNGEIIQDLTKIVITQDKYPVIYKIISSLERGEDDGRDMESSERL